MFVTFEGPEGAGKSSVIHALSERLDTARIPNLVTREPGAGAFGQEIRRLLLHGENLPSTTELFLFLADRAHHMVNVIQPALAEGLVVLCDRHAESTIVYQGYARGLDITFLRKMNDLATEGKRPGLIILLDVPVELGLARVTDRNRLDDEPLAFHQKVRAGFLAEQGHEPSRWHVVDASQDFNQVVESCVSAISARLRKLF